MKCKRLYSLFCALCISCASMTGCETTKAQEVDRIELINGNGEKEGEYVVLETVHNSLTGIDSYSNKTLEVKRDGNFARDRNGNMLVRDYTVANDSAIGKTAVKGASDFLSSFFFRGFIGADKSSFVGGGANIDNHNGQTQVQGQVTQQVQQQWWDQ